jgi:hypothetical protein
VPNPSRATPFVYPASPHYPHFIVVDRATSAFNGLLGGRSSVELEFVFGVGVEDGDKTIDPRLPDVFVLVGIELRDLFNEKRVHDDPVAIDDVLVGICPRFVDRDGDEPAVHDCASEFFALRVRLTWPGVVPDKKQWTDRNDAVGPRF